MVARLTLFGYSCLAKLYTPELEKNQMSMKKLKMQTLVAGIVFSAAFATMIIPSSPFPGSEGNIAVNAIPSSPFPGSEGSKAVNAIPSSPFPGSEGSKVA